jgi:hypothetical protein
MVRVRKGAVQIRFEILEYLFYNREPQPRTYVWRNATSLAYDARALLIVGALVYTVSALYAQHRFFRKWERRIGLLLHMEERILSEELEKDG